MTLGPKCQGAAARDWLAERQAELLPVGYFHIVFTLPAQIADIAYHNKAVIYDILFEASAETLLTIAANLARARQLLGVQAPAKAGDSEVATDRDEANASTQPCPCCGGRMIVIDVFEAGCQPKHRPMPEAIDSA